MRTLAWACRAAVVGMLAVGQVVGCASPGIGSGGAQGGASSKGQLAQAQKAIEDGKYNEAIKLCDAVIAAEPDNAEAYKARGLARMSIPYVPRAAAPKPSWTTPRPRYAPEPEWLGRIPALQDLTKAGELRGNRDPVVWYLRSVFHTKEALLHPGQRRSNLRQADEALQEAEKLDPGNAGYRRARELLVPQMYFANRAAHLDESPYTGQYADVVQLGDKQPYGEVMKGYGWKPGMAWTPPAAGTSPGNRAKSSDSGELDDPTTIILLGIGALFVLGAMGQGSGGGGGGSARSGCMTCGGTRQLSHWNHVTGQIEWRRCWACAGR